MAMPSLQPGEFLQLGVLQKGGRRHRPRLQMAFADETFQNHDEQNRPSSCCPGRRDPTLNLHRRVIFRTLSSRLCRHESRPPGLGCTNRHSPPPSTPPLPRCAHPPCASRHAWAQAGSKRRRTLEIGTMVDCRLGLWRTDVGRFIYKYIGRVAVTSLQKKGRLLAAAHTIILVSPCSSRFGVTVRQDADLLDGDVLLRKGGWWCNPAFLPQSPRTSPLVAAHLRATCSGLLCPQLRRILH